MDRLPLPEILDALARAGEEGLAASGVDAAGREALERLAAAGFPVRAGPDRVYLDDDHDCLVPDWVRRDAVVAGIPEPRVHGFLELDSTNAVGLELCREGAAHGTLVWAEAQHAGRGRLGRVWSSPARVGLYLSLVLRPTRGSGEWPLLSLACGWAVAAAIADATRAEVSEAAKVIRLKWPNDVLLAGRKISGILLESCTGSGSPGGLVAGIGINVRAGAVPPGLEAAATSLEEGLVALPRRRLLVAVMRRVQEACGLFERGGDDALLDRWQGCSGMWKDCRIRVFREGQPREALTLGLDRSGGLRVRYGDGAVETLVADEVSIREGEALP